MALYNFQKRFVPKILSGEKRHTIRAKRKRATKPGELLHLYTGLRQKGAQLLMRTRCTRVEEIIITSDAKILINRERLDISECHQLARSDGFKDFWDMMVFWNGRRPFTGDIIHWKFPPEPQSCQEFSPCANASAPDAKKRSRATIAIARKNAAEPPTTKTGARCAKPSRPARNTAQPADTARR
jgi:uncharacterized protein YqfB (UPF0267 family)